MGSIIWRFGSTLLNLRWTCEDLRLWSTLDGLRRGSPWPVLATRRTPPSRFVILHRYFPDLLLRRRRQQYISFPWVSRILSASKKFALTGQVSSAISEQDEYGTKYCRPFRGRQSPLSTMDCHIRPCCCRHLLGMTDGT